jgi:hypothetical protein
MWELMESQMTIRRLHETWRLSLGDTEVWRLGAVGGKRAKKRRASWESQAFVPHLD